MLAAAIHGIDRVVDPLGNLLSLFQAGEWFVVGRGHGSDLDHAANLIPSWSLVGQSFGRIVGFEIDVRFGTLTAVAVVAVGLQKRL